MLAAPAGTLLFADVSCSTEFRPWIFGNPANNTQPTQSVGGAFDIVGGRVQVNRALDTDKPHRFWRINLKGFSLPEDPQDPYANRGFATYGRLWKALFWIKRDEEEFCYRASTGEWETEEEDAVLPNPPDSFSESNFPSMGGSRKK